MAGRLLLVSEDDRAAARRAARARCTSGSWSSASTSPSSCSTSSASWGCRGASTRTRTCRTGPRSTWCRPSARSSSARRRSSSLANVMRSLRAGAIAGDNPWNAWTLEWATTSPPPHAQLRRAAPGPRPPPALGSRASGGARRARRPRRAAPATPRPRAAKVAVLSFIASEAAFFVLLIVAYVFYTATSQGGPSPDASLDRARTGVFTVLLLASSFTLWRAEKSHDARQPRTEHRLARRDDRARRRVPDRSGHRVRAAVPERHHASRPTSSRRRSSRSPASTGFTSSSGSSRSAIVLALALAGRALSGRLGEGLRAVGYYWHFVDVVWIVVFSVVYLRGAL